MARRGGKAKVEKENSERWLLTYADMITLLMTFFIVLYATSKTDTAKFTQIQAALERAFNVEVLQGRTLAVSTDGSGAGALIQSMFTEPEYQTDVDRIQQHLRQAAATSGHGDSPDVAVGATREGIVIRLSGSFLFDSSRAELKPASLWQLDVIAEELRQMSNDIRVEGHTDNVPVDSPRFPTNWELSVARAIAVTRYMTEEGGIASSRIGAAGYGEFRPIAPNDAPKNRSLNRRVEIRVLASKPPLPASADTGTPRAGATAAPSPAAANQREVHP